LTDTKRLQERLARAARIACDSYGMRGTEAFAAFAERRADALRKSRLSADRAIASARGRGIVSKRVDDHAVDEVKRPKTGDRLDRQRPIAGPGRSGL